MSTYAQLDSRNGGQVRFDGVHMTGRVDGTLLDMTLAQTFHNAGAKHIELVYTFPLPAGAVLLAMHASLGERRLSARVAPRRAASEAYEVALAEGNAAIMLEQTADGSYCLNLGNLAPGETGVLTLRYAQALRFDGDGLRLCIPTVIAPRFGDPVRDGGLAPHQASTPALLAHYPFALSLHIGRQLADSRLASPSHDIVSSTTEGGRTVALRDGAALDRDFVLTLGDLARASCAIAAPDPVTPGQWIVSAGFRPRFNETAARPLRVNILVDCSGSMAGDSIAASRRALLAAVARLDGEDRFSLSRFGNDVEHHTPHLNPASSAAQAQARRWIDALRADMGGTHMADALLATFALDDAAPGDVLMVTDGHLHDVDGVLRSAKKARHRLFIIAIGSAISELHLRRLALASGGAVDFVAPGEAVQPAIARMFARMRSPRLSSLRLAWSHQRQVRWSVLPDCVFSGDTVQCHAAIDGALEDWWDSGEVRLYGREMDGVEHEVGLAIIEHAAADDALIARLAVHARLADTGALDTAQQLQLACAYALITGLTNFVMTVERAAGDKAQAMPDLQQVPQMLAAGWGGAGSVLHDEGLSFKQPVMWRRDVSMESAVLGDSRESFQIPAFLHGADLGEAPRKADGYLSPLALHILLSSTERSLWDKTYEDMDASGIDPAVVLWLKQLFGAGRSDQAVVAGFMECMAALTMGQVLRGLGGRSWRHVIRGREVALLPHTASDELARHIARGLEGTTAGVWALGDAADHVAVEAEITVT